MKTELVDVKCNLCDNNITKSIGFVKLTKDNQDLFSSERLNVVQCKKCGLVYTNPRPSELVLNTYYNKNYCILKDKNEILKNKCNLCCGGGYVTYDLRYCKRLLSEMSKLIVEKGKMLDVGCGEGRFLKIAHDNGWQVYGQEISDEVVNSIQTKYNLNVRAGKLKDLNFPDNYFNIVIMLNVIEHLTDPSEYLREIYRIMKKDAVVYISAPNIILLNKYIELDIPEHIYYFSVKSIQKMLEKTGFKIIKLTTINKQDTLVYLDILKDYISSYSKNIKENGMKAFLLNCIKLSYNIINSATGIKLFRYGIKINGGQRITAIVKKIEG